MSTPPSRLSSHPTRCTRTPCRTRRRWRAACPGEEPRFQDEWRCAEQAAKDKGFTLIKIGIPNDRFVRSHLKTCHLVLLAELGRHGSIMHAAQAANLTQPAASKLLGELEHALGVQLFERLRAGELDLVLGRILDTGAAAELRFEPVTDEPHSLIARALEYRPKRSKRWPCRSSRTCSPVATCWPPCAKWRRCAIRPPLEPEAGVCDLHMLVSK